MVVAVVCLVGVAIEWCSTVASDASIGFFGVCDRSVTTIERAFG